MRIVHTSDTHLGHQQYPRTDANGLNQREADLYASWMAVVRAAVQNPPDAFVHAGDLFDGVRPGNRALAAAMDGFLHLSRAGIPTVVIAGNHEHPKLRETGSPLRLFEHLPNLHVAYRGERETTQVPTKSGPLRIHAVPQCADNEELASQVASAPTGGPGVDVLVVHGSIPSIPAFHHAEFNELTLDASWFKPFHYVALGHYHGAQKVVPNAWYCGAPDRVSIAEAGQEKGYLDVSLSGGQAEATLLPIATRPYIDLPPLDAEGLDASTVRRAAEEALHRVPAGAVCRLRLSNLDPSLRGSLDLRAIQKAGAHALQCEIKLEWSDAGVHVRGGSELGPLAQEFEQFAARQPLAGLDRDRLLAKAKALLEAP